MKKHAKKHSTDLRIKRITVRPLGNSTSELGRAAGGVGTIDFSIRSIASMPTGKHPD